MTATPTCAPDCNGVECGEAEIDQCGICGGNDSTCKDCADVINGSAKPDQCGVCNGDNSCLDCAGVPWGASQFDACRVCNGTNSCVDCAGIPFGNSVVDSCGVCNGKDSCLDCAGIPFGNTKIDCCGVCGGDGSSCEEKCQRIHTQKLKAQIIKDTNTLVKFIRSYVKRARNCGRDISEEAKLALSLQQEIKTLLNTIIDNIVVVCDTPYCKRTEFTQTLKLVKFDESKLLRISQKSQRQVAWACKLPNGKFNKNSEVLYSQIIKNVGKLPTEKCTK